MTQELLLTMGGTRTALDGLADLLSQHTIMRPLVDDDTFTWTCSCGEFKSIGVDPTAEWRDHVAAHMFRRIQTWPNTWQHQLMPSMFLPLKLIGELNSNNATVEGAASLARRCLGDY